MLVMRLVWNDILLAAILTVLDHYSEQHKPHLLYETQLVIPGFWRHPDDEACLTKQGSFRTLRVTFKEKRDQLYRNGT